MNKNLLSLAILASVGLSASAAIRFVDQTITLPGGFVAPTTGGSAFSAGTVVGNAQGALDVDLPLETLVGVSYSIDGFSYVNYNITSGGAGASVALIGNVTIKGPDVTSPALVANVGFGPVVVGQTAGSTGTGPIVVGVQSDNANLADYNINGNVPFTLDASGQAFIGGTDGAGGTISPFAGGKVYLRYTFETRDIPEASTYATGAVLLAGVGFVARRRMAKA